MVVNSVLLANKSKLISKHQYGGNFYKNWSKSEIAKLQMFLASEDKLGDERYLGEFDGIMGPETFKAIKAYQRKHGLKHVDGLWGYNTNLIHRPLLSSTLDKGSYKPNQKTDMSSLVPRKTSFTYVNADQLPQHELDKAINYYYANPELFFSDDPDASYWRQVFHNSGKWGADHINMIGTLVDPAKRNNIGSKKLTTGWKTEAIKDDMYKAQKTVMPGVLAALSAPAVLVNPTGVGAAAIGSLVGSSAGDTWGELVGRDRAQNPDNNHYSSEDPMEQRYGGATVIYDPEKTVEDARNTGRFIGGVVGGLGAGYASQFLKAPTMQDLRSTYAQSPRLHNRKTTLQDYKPRAVRSDKGKTQPRPKRKRPVKPKVPTQHINFENLAQRKAIGGPIYFRNFFK